MYSSKFVRQSLIQSTESEKTLAIFAMYVLARIIGQLLGIIDAGISIDHYNYLSMLLQFISLIVPRLDLMAQTNWLVYGTFYEISFGFVILQGIFYCTFIFSASLVDLVRKQF